ncbi:MAG: methylmalonyl-CoA epimerase [Lewinella sp.]|jgi:thiopurine S-methyltransferase|nr:methylmalonyl-CoA epimerase [Lewinella sp.]
MRLDHIGIAVADLTAAENLIARLLGRKSYKRETVAEQHVTTSFFTAGASDAKLELVAAEGEQGPIHKHLEKRGPGIHHLAFEVDDIEAEMKRLAADGFELLQEKPSKGADNKLVCFLHPKSTNGVLVEICQSIKTTSDPADYWGSRYDKGNTGWDIGYPSPPITNYLDQIPDKSLRLLIPGAGNAYEAEYAWKLGFTNVFVIDVAEQPLKAFALRVPDFPPEQLIQGDFFEHTGQYDLILEQTFFCSFPPLPETRSAYAEKQHALLAPGGKLVGLWFDVPLTGDLEKRPFGGTQEEYKEYFAPYFETESFTPATNSIAPRMGSELFGIFRKAGI